MKFFVFIVLLTISYTVTGTLQNENERQTPEKQFDFWLGKWNVYSGENLVGKNTIVYLQDKHVLQENWVSEKENFTGTSYSFYNPKIKKWQQIWIDKNGNNLILQGNFTDNKMVLRSDSTSYMGEPNSKHKLTWFMMPNGNVKQIWESTTDNGKNWTIQFEGIYKKQDDTD